MGALRVFVFPPHFLSEAENLSNLNPPLLLSHISLLDYIIVMIIAIIATWLLKRSNNDLADVQKKFSGIILITRDFKSYKLQRGH